MPAEEEKEQEKVAIISSTNTIVDPRAVVIEAINASKKEKNQRFLRFADTCKSLRRNLADLSPLKNHYLLQTEQCEERGGL